jgi:MFS family permease
VEQFATETTAAGKPAIAADIMAGWGSILPVGQFLANISLPFLSARHGHKTAFAVCRTFLAASIIGEGQSRRWEHWLVAKLLAGIGLGCLQCTLPMYIAEVAPTRIRGMVLMTYNLWWTVGTFFAYLAMERLSQVNTHDWLTPVYSQWAQIGLMGIIFLALPESPAWAVGMNHRARAQKSLARLYKGVDGFDVDHQIEVLSMLAHHEAELAATQKREKWYAVLRGTDGFLTIVALWTIVSQQFTGLVLFSTFGAYFFQQAGVGDPFQIKCITLGIKLVAAIAVVYVADTVGRRLISCTGSTAMWTTSLLVGILGVVPRTKAVNYVFILFAVIWSKEPQHKTHQFPLP